MAALRRAPEARASRGGRTQGQAFPGAYGVRDRLDTGQSTNVTR